MTPTIFHVTHWKAGSQWVRAVLEAAAPHRIVRERRNDGFLEASIVDGGIYTPVYASYELFRGVVPATREQRTFAVIRDPRDTAVSWYFSLLHSHSTKNPTVGESRELLRRLSKTDGLALVISNHLSGAVAIQKSWLETGTRIFRYEELLADQHQAFGQMLDFCALDLPESRRKRIVARNSFARKTWFRFGRENTRSHLRKGMSGDWRNHFCDRLKKLFKMQYSRILIDAGYEKNDDW